MLDPFESSGVGAQHPFQQCREERRPVEAACVARPGDAFGELVQDLYWSIVRGDHPVFADDAFESDEFVLVVAFLAGGVRRYVDVTAKVVKDRLPIGGSEPVSRSLAKVERLSDLVRVVAITTVEVDPQQLRPLQPLRPVGEAIEPLYLVPVEEDGTAHAQPPEAGDACSAGRSLAHS